MFTRLLGQGLVAGIPILPFAYLIHNFVASDGLHYFSDQPHRLLLIAIISITGGLALFGFSALSRRFQRMIKLALFGFGAAFVTLAGIHFSLQFYKLTAAIDLPIFWRIPWVLVLGTMAIAGPLWFGFYQTLRNRGRVAESRR